MKVRIAFAVLAMSVGMTVYCGEAWGQPQQKGLGKAGTKVPDKGQAGLEKAGAGGQNAQGGLQKAGGKVPQHGQAGLQKAQGGLQKGGGVVPQQGQGGQKGGKR